MLASAERGRKPHIGLASSTCGVEIARLQHLGLCCCLWQASVKELKLKKHGYPPKASFAVDSNICVV